MGDYPVHLIGNKMLKTQEQLYEEFMAKTANERAAMEAAVATINADYEVYARPAQATFDSMTADLHAELMEKFKAIDQKHRYACHKVAMVAHRKIDKLERDRKKLVKPLQNFWDANTKKEQEWLKSELIDKQQIAEEQIQKLNADYVELTKPLHEEYMREAAILEEQSVAAQFAQVEKEKENA